MIWLFLASFAGMTVVATAAWARAERRKVEREAAERREAGRLRAEEAQLLARLKNKDS